MFPVLSLMLIEHGRPSSGEARRFAAAACLDWKAVLLPTVSTCQSSSQQERGVNEGGCLLLCVQTVRFVCTGSPRGVCFSDMLRNEKPVYYVESSSGKKWLATAAEQIGEEET